MQSFDVARKKIQIRSLIDNKSTILELLYIYIFFFFLQGRKKNALYSEDSEGSGSESEITKAKQNHPNAAAKGHSITRTNGPMSNICGQNQGEAMGSGISRGQRQEGSQDLFDDSDDGFNGGGTAQLCLDGTWDDEETRKCSSQGSISHTKRSSPGGLQTRMPSTTHAAKRRKVCDMGTFATDDVIGAAGKPRDVALFSLDGTVDEDIESPFSSSTERRNQGRFVSSTPLGQKRLTENSDSNRRSLSKKSKNSVYREMPRSGRYTPKQLNYVVGELREVNSSEPAGRERREMPEEHQYQEYDDEELIQNLDDDEAEDSSFTVRREQGSQCCKQRKRRSSDPDLSAYGSNHTGGQQNYGRRHSRDQGANAGADIKREDHLNAPDHKTSVKQEVSF